MGRLFLQHLDNDIEPKYACSNCSNELCYVDLDVIRSDYQCQSGVALFTANIINVIEGAIVNKHFISGHYIIQDIFCTLCFQCVGWKYIKALEEDNKFKENNYVIEFCKVKKVEPRKPFSGLYDGSYKQKLASHTAPALSPGRDEDECIEIN
jgi:hypothetical protein